MIARLRSLKRLPETLASNAGASVPTAADGVDGVLWTDSSRAEIQARTLNLAALIDLELRSGFEGASRGRSPRTRYKK